jgi:hypothetical protein
MISRQGGYELKTHGGRVPIPWIIRASGWAMFFHQPSGTFDFTGAQSKFEPASGVSITKEGRELKLATSGSSRTVHLDGKQVEVKF